MEMDLSIGFQSLSTAPTTTDSVVETFRYEYTARLLLESTGLIARLKLTNGLDPLQTPVRSLCASDRFTPVVY